MDKIIESLRSNWKRYLVSMALTFLAGFLAVVLSSLDNLTIDCLTNGTLAGVIFVGVRTGLKVALEYVLSILINK